MNKYQYTVQGVEYDVEIIDVEGNIAKVNVNGMSFEVEMKQPISPANAIVKPKIDTPRPVAAPVVGTAPAPEAPAPVQAGSGTPVKAPLPGTINGVNVKVGDAVKAGDTIVVLEAMKMQNNIEAECDGTVTSVAVKQGDSVLEGALLVTIG